MKDLLKKTLKAIKNSLKRFPQAIGISTSCVILLIYISEVKTQFNGDFIEFLSRVTMILALGIPLSLCIKLYFERLETYKKASLYVSYLLGAILLSLYYYFFLKNIGMISTSRYAAFSLILYLVFICITYLPNRDGFELYVVKAFSRFFTTVLYSFVLYLGLSAILFTIDKLLGVNIISEFYYYTALIVAGVFAPSFFLAGIPFKNEILTLKDYSRLLNVLILYIVMPLICVYTIILYIYFGKIIITRQWPQGLVSHLVLWYSVICVTVYFFISPLINEKSWPRRFIKYFPKVILPLMVMIFISIWIRINAYGVTENRYFVVVLSLWVFLVMIYFASTKKLMNIILPVSFVIITFVSVFGPFSSYSISKYSQNSRLNNIFIKNNMISGNKVVKVKTKVTDEDAKQITSILNYFNRYHNLEDVKGLPKKFKISELEKVLGVKYIEENNENNNGYYFFNSTATLEPMDIKGYNYLFDLRNNNTQQITRDTIYNMTFDNQSTLFKITQNGKNIYEKNLQDFATVLINKYGINQKNQSIAQKEMSFEDENSKVKIKIHFLNLSGNQNISNGKLESKNFEFYVLVKLK